MHLQLMIRRLLVHLLPGWQHSFMEIDHEKKGREKSRECHNHKPQPFPDPKRKRKPTNPNKHKLNKRTKSTKISSLTPKGGNRNNKRTKKHKNRMTYGKTYNKSSLRINHKATKSKTNTETTGVISSVILILPLIQEGQLSVSGERMCTLLLNCLED